MSSTEWRLMRSCLRRGRVTIAEMHEDAAAETPTLTLRTATTLVGRLVAKGHLEVEEEGRRPLRFIARIGREEAVKAAAAAFARDPLGNEPENLRIAELYLRDLRLALEGRVDGRSRRERSRRL